MSKILLISYDNGSHIPFFPQHLFYLYGALKKAGHTVGFWFQDIHHGSEEALTHVVNAHPWDIVGLGFVAGYWQYAKAKQIAEAVGKTKRRDKFNFVLGGHGPAAEPDWFMNKLGADTVVVGDGESAICEIAAGNKKGIVLGVPCTSDETPVNTYEDFPLNVYRLIRWPTSSRTDFCFPVLSSRGCKWSCSFCYRMREGFHERAVEAIMEEIKWLHDRAQITHFQFSDELLMSSERRVGDICEALLNLPFRIKWDCNGRLNYATTDTLRLMRSSGCEYINYGIESLSQKLLNQMGKGLTLNQIESGVQATLRSGISPGLNLIWGFPGDTAENLWQAVKFLKKYDPCHELRTIRPVTPYPGCRLYEEAKEKGLLEGPEDFYEVKHKNSDLFTVNFMDISTEEAHRQLWIANDTLIENYFNKRKHLTCKQGDKLYLEGDTNFRGFRSV